MGFLFKNVTICEPGSKFHQKKLSILVDDEGIIQSIEKNIKNVPSKVKTIEINEGYLSPGWFDLRMALRDPGFEYKETLISASKAAQYGGYTHVGCLPVTNPPIHSKSEASYIINSSRNLNVEFIPYGCISYNREGKDLAELYDMFQSGVPAFSDGNKPVMQAGLMMRALLYSRTFNGLIMSHAEDLTLSASGRMHEGVISTELGIKGIPSIAEELMVERDLELANYCESRVHFSHVSSRGSIERIRKAKKRGIRVSCDVSIAHLCFTEENLINFNSNFKLNPPLRTKEDKKALWDGLIDGTIDCIVSDHQPENIENKNIEFEYAAQGMINLQTTYSLFQMYKPKNINDDLFIQATAINPRKILNLKPVTIDNKQVANFTLFQPDLKWMYNEKSNQSNAQNHPLFNTELKGKAIGIFNKQNYHENI